MRTADRLVGLAAVLLGAYVAWQASGMEYHGIYGPGPGFLPLWLGASTIVCGAVILSQTRVRRAEQDSVPFDMDRAMALRVGFAVVALVASVWLYQYVGFALSFGVFIAVVLRVLDRLPLSRILAVSVLTPAIFWAVFDLVLGVRLPAGLLGG